MPVAIKTKYVGPTDTKGSRIIATANGNRVSIPYSHSGDAHQKAAKAICEKMGWTGQLVEGGTEDGKVFVFLDGPIISA